MTLDSQNHKSQDILFPVAIAFLLGIILPITMMDSIRAENRELKIIVSERNDEIDKLQAKIEGLLSQ